MNSFSINQKINQFKTPFRKYHNSFNFQITLKVTQKMISNQQLKLLSNRESKKKKKKKKKKLLLAAKRTKTPIQRHKQLAEAQAQRRIRKHNDHNAKGSLIGNSLKVKTKRAPF